MSENEEEFYEEDYESAEDEVEMTGEDLANFIEVQLATIDAMLTPYEERMVDRYESDTVIVSTIRAVEGHKDFETAVASPLYYDGKWIVVSAYDTIEFAKQGHEEWVKRMTTEPLPEELCDVGNTRMAELYRKAGLNTCFKKTEV